MILYYNILIKHLRQAKHSYQGFFIFLAYIITMTASKASIIRSLLDFNFARPLTQSPLKHVLKQVRLILGHISFGFMSEP